jgi:hypothetical protein
MKPSQVIKFFLNIHKYRLTMYQISKNADISASAVTRIVDEIHKDVSLSMLQKIASGLALINPYFEPVFWSLVSAKDIINDPRMPYIPPNDPYIDPAEHPEAIRRVIEHLEKRYPALKKAIDEDRKAYEAQCNPFDLEEIVSLQMQQQRREE